MYILPRFGRRQATASCATARALSGPEAEGVALCAHCAQTRAASYASHAGCGPRYLGLFGIVVESRQRARAELGFGLEAV
jgi:hypothetical protein